MTQISSEYRLDIYYIFIFIQIDCLCICVYTLLTCVCHRVAFQMHFKLRMNSRPDLNPKFAVYLVKKENSTKFIIAVVIDMEETMQYQTVFY